MKGQWVEKEEWRKGGRVPHTLPPRCIKSLPVEEDEQGEEPQDIQKLLERTAIVDSKRLAHIVVNLFRSWNIEFFDAIGGDLGIFFLEAFRFISLRMMDCTREKEEETSEKRNPVSVIGEDDRKYCYTILTKDGRSWIWMVDRGIYGKGYGQP